GWGIGMAIGRLALPVLLSLGPSSIGNGSVGLIDSNSVAVDARVAIAGLGLALLAAVLVGLIPAWQATRRDVAGSLKAGAATPQGQLSLKRPGAQQLLVVSEVALALMLLVGAGLLLRTFAGLEALKVGFEPANVLTLKYAAADSDLARRDARTFKAEV